ncbi:ATP-binding protein [Streptomyces sp. NPDC000349]|uniref:ATP-binding protein n=1 Tax=unclassified Streptomyces TaxID=2593676 RepID=UPI00277D3F7E|nr:ATP-binding protein [Streptomyces sp. DSM 40167]MDQ0404026.1 anti-sigma regulatory factor (Ser/Thr protein kinase) [Streptomyces sp. DSM 40167]
MSGKEVRERQARSVLPFRAVPAEVRLLRQAAKAQLRQWGVPHAATETELVVTELATNVIKHVGEGTSATLVLEWGTERLRVEVHDKSHSMPSVSPAGCDDECGRGLHLLAVLTADWGTVLTAAGKSVWCEIALGPERAYQRMERAVAALEGYRPGGTTTRQGRLRDAVLKESAVELIADLLHWTASCGFDPDDILDQAQSHYEAEPGVAA